jgi:hypothetical protein
MALTLPVPLQRSQKRGQGDSSTLSRPFPLQSGQTIFMCDILPHYDAPDIHPSMPLSTIGENQVKFPISKTAIAAVALVVSAGIANAQTVTGTVTGQHSGVLCLKFRVQTMSGTTAFQYAIPNGTSFDSLRADWTATVSKNMSREFVANPSPGPSACTNNTPDVFELYQIN